MEYKQIRDTEQYPGSPHLTLSRFHGPSSKKSTSADTEDVLLIFDISFIEEQEMDISFPEPQLLQVSFKHGFKNTGRLSCRRDCAYTFKFPKEIKEEDLIAQWTEDDFLVIMEKKPTEIKKSDKETPEEKDHQQASGVLENSKLEASSVSSSIRTEEELTGESSQNIDGKSEVAEEVKDVKETKREFEKEVLEESPKPKSVPRLIPQKVNKIYKPIISVSELKSVLSDIENRMLFVKHFLDDRSFDFSWEEDQKPL